MRERAMACENSVLEGDERLEHEGIPKAFLAPRHEACINVCCDSEFVQSLQGLVIGLAGNWELTNFVKPNFGSRKTGASSAGSAHTCSLHELRDVLEVSFG